MFKFYVLVVGMICVALGMSPMASAAEVVFEGFEGSYSIGVCDLAIDCAGVTTSVTNVTEGTHALYVPMDSPYYYGSGSIGWTFASPVNLSGYDTLALDIYFPNLADFLSHYYSDGQAVNIGISDAAGEQYMYAIRVNGPSGWNQISVAVNSITRDITAITSMRVTIYNQPGAAGSYVLIDNVRGMRPSTPTEVMLEDLQERVSDIEAILAGGVGGGISEGDANELIDAALAPIINTYNTHTHDKGSGGRNTSTPSPQIQ